MPGTYHTVRSLRIVALRGSPDRDCGRVVHSMGKPDRDRIGASGLETTISQCAGNRVGARVPSVDCWLAAPPSLSLKFEFGQAMETALEDS